MTRQKNIMVVCTTDSMIWNFLIPHIKLLQEQGYQVECACSKTGDFFAKLHSEYGLHVTELSLSRSPFKYSNITALMDLVKLLKKKQIDVVYCHEPVGGVIGRLAGFFCGCKIVYMAHGFHFFKGSPKKNWLLYFPVELILSKITDLLITINQEDYQFATKNMLAESMVYLPGVGLDISKFRPSCENVLAVRKKIGIPDGKLWIIAVGELIERKNHETLIRSLVSTDRYYLTIVGTGVLRDSLLSLISSLGVQEKAQLIGYRDDICDLCNAADIFCLPSFQEGLSVALMEAMACSKPIIASNIRGNIDLVESNGGVLFDPYSIEACENALRQMAKRSDLSLMGVFNRKKIEKYSIEEVLPRFVRHFNECIS